MHNHFRLNVAKLVVEGDDAALDAFRTAINLEQTETWKKGGESRLGDAYTCSGFAATIADAATPVELMADIRRFLVSCKKRGSRFRAPELSVELSIGIRVGDSAQYLACVDFTQFDLLILSELGINVNIWALPTLD